MLYFLRIKQYFIKGYAEIVRLLESVVLIWLNASYFIWVYTLKYYMPRSMYNVLISLIKGNVQKVKDFVVQYLPAGIQQHIQSVFLRIIL